MEELIQNHMRILGISREEAIQLIEDDKRIDRGEKLFELPPELEKGAKKARCVASADRKKSTAKREKKVDDDKRHLINHFTEGLENVNVLNPEREFEFFYNGKKYKLVLSVPRS
jgi:hypothetical protein